MKTKTLKNYGLFTTDLFTYTEDFDMYEAYKDYCIDNGIYAKEDDSVDYYEWLHREIEADWECFRDNLQHSRANDQRCMVTGNLGLWNGNFRIEERCYDTLLSAILDCISGADDFDIVLNDGHIEVNAYHHDGTNRFDIHLLSKKGEAEVARPKYTWYGHSFEPKPFWFKNINGYLF